MYDVTTCNLLSLVSLFTYFLPPGKWLPGRLLLSVHVVTLLQCTEQNPFQYSTLPLQATVYPGPPAQQAHESTREHRKPEAPHADRAKVNTICRECLDFGRHILIHTKTAHEIQTMRATALLISCMLQHYHGIQICFKGLKKVQSNFLLGRIKSKKKYLSGLAVALRRRVVPLSLRNEVF